MRICAMSVTFDAPSKRRWPLSLRSFVAPIRRCRDGYIYNFPVRRGTARIDIRRPDLPMASERFPVPRLTGRFGGTVPRLPGRLFPVWRGRSAPLRGERRTRLRIGCAPLEKLIRRSATVDPFTFVVRARQVRESHERGPMESIRPAAPRVGQEPALHERRERAPELVFGSPSERPQRRERRSNAAVVVAVVERPKVYPEAPRSIGQRAPRERPIHDGVDQQEAARGALALGVVSQEVV